MCLSRVPCYSRAGVFRRVVDRRFLVVALLLKYIGVNATIPLVATCFVREWLPRFLPKLSVESDAL